MELERLKKYAIKYNKFHYEQLLETFDRYINQDHKYSIMIDKLEQKLLNQIKDFRYDMTCKCDDIDSRTE